MARFLPSLRAAGLALVAGCVGDGVQPSDGLDAPESVESDTSLALRAARWQASWLLAGAERFADGGFALTTDEGYRVVIEEAWLVDYSVTLVPCPETESVALRLLGIGIAQAHHGEFEDPSQLEPVAVEGFEDPKQTAVALGGSTFPGASYCGVHWLLARGDDDSVAPDGSSAWGRAVHLAGTWERGDEAGEIAIDTSLAQGMLRTIDQADLHGVGDGAVITIERHLGTMFDGIDFEVANANATDWAVVSNLVEQATVSIACAEVSDGAKF